MPLKIMISYPSEKLKIATDVYEFLSGLGLDIWFDKRNLVGGDSWDREINKAIDQSEMIVMITSLQTISKSGVVQRELNKALHVANDKPIGANFIVNLRADNVSLPPELSKYQWIDMFSENWRLGLVRSILKRVAQLERDPGRKFEAVLNDLERENDTRAHSFESKIENIDLNGSYFTYNIDDEYWNYVNSEIINNIYQDYYVAIRVARENPGDTDLSWSRSVGEFFRHEDILSLKIKYYEYFGGAHGNHGISTLNFAGADYGKISLGNLFDNRIDLINYITKYCELDITRQLLAVGDEINLDIKSTTHSDDLYELFKNFSFNKNGLTFDMNPYSILAYAYGSFEFTLPWTNLRDKINPIYRQSKIFKVANEI